METELEIRGFLGGEVVLFCLLNKNAGWPRLASWHWLRSLLVQRKRCECTRGKCSLWIGKTRVFVPSLHTCVESTCGCIRMSEDCCVLGFLPSSKGQASWRTLHWIGERPCLDQKKRSEGPKWRSTSTFCMRGAPVVLSSCASVS